MQRSRSNCGRIPEKHFSEDVVSHTCVFLFFHCIVSIRVEMHLTCMTNGWMIGCGIGIEGAKRIGEMLGKNTSLMKLELCCGSTEQSSHFHPFLSK
jgi:hypothetical protein